MSTQEMFDRANRATERLFRGSRSPYSQAAGGIRLSGRRQMEQTTAFMQQQEARLAQRRAAMAPILMETAQMRARHQGQWALLGMKREYLDKLEAARVRSRERAEDRAQVMKELGIQQRGMDVRQKERLAAGVKVKEEERKQAEAKAQKVERKEVAKEAKGDVAKEQARAIAQRKEVWAAQKGVEAAYDSAIAKYHADETPRVQQAVAGHIMRDDGTLMSREEYTQRQMGPLLAQLPKVLATDAEIDDVVLELTEELGRPPTEEETEARLNEQGKTIGE